MLCASVECFCIVKIFERYDVIIIYRYIFVSTLRNVNYAVLRKIIFCSEGFRFKNHFKTTFPTLNLPSE